MPDDDNDSVTYGTGHTPAEKIEEKMKSLETAISQFQYMMEHYQNQILELHRQLIAMVGDKAEADKNTNTDMYFLDKEVKRTKSRVPVEENLKNDQTPRHHHDVTLGAGCEPSTKKAMEMQEIPRKMCVEMENFDHDMSYHELKEMNKKSVGIEDTEDLYMENDYISRGLESQEEGLLCKGQNCKLTKEACLFLHCL
jgi:hypothetical protein